MGKHRTRLKILANILSVISENHGVKKTQIMYRAYLSYSLLVQYLTDLTEARLIVCEYNKCYKLTENGINFLKEFHKYDKSREIVNDQLKNITDQRTVLHEMCPNSGGGNFLSKNQNESKSNN